MGCGCGGKAAAAREAIKYVITDDPEGRKYLTEREALAAKSALNLEGAINAVKG